MTNAARSVKTRARCGNVDGRRQQNTSWGDILRFGKLTSYCRRYMFVPLEAGQRLGDSIYTAYSLGVMSTESYRRYRITKNMTTPGVAGKSGTWHVVTSEDMTAL